MSAMKPAAPAERETAPAVSEKPFFTMLAGLFLICLFSYGITVSVIGFLLEPMSLSLGQGMGRISAIASMIFLVPAFATPAVSWLLARFSPRIALMGGGLLAGIGYVVASQVDGYASVLAAFFLVGLGLAGCGVVPCIMIADRWTERRRALAAGVLFSSVALGAFISPALAEYVISTHGWRVEVLLTGAFFILGVVPLGWIFGRYPAGVEPPRGPAASAAAAAVTRRALLGAVGHPMFWAICLMECVFSIGLIGAYIYAPLFLVDAGYSLQASAWIFSVLNLITIAGTVSLGVLSDRYGAALALLAGLLLHAVALFLAQAVGASALGLAGLLVFVLLWGMTNNIGFQLTPVLLGDQFGMKLSGALYGITRLGAGIAQALGPIIAGHAYDLSGSYRSSFMVCAVIVAASVLPALFIFFKLHARKRDRAVTTLEGLEIVG